MDGETKIPYNWTTGTLYLATVSQKESTQGTVKAGKVSDMQRTLTVRYEEAPEYRSE